MKALSKNPRQSCIDACSHCYQTCLQMAMNHCILNGGKYVEPKHLRLMMNCVEICQMSVNFQLSDSSFSSRLCGVCAEVCDACAKSCEDLGGMDDCVTACRDCASSCHSMSAMSH